MRTASILTICIAALTFSACSGDDGKSGEKGADGVVGGNGSNGKNGDPGAVGAKGDDGSSADIDVKSAVRTAVDDAIDDAIGPVVDDELDARKKGCDAIDMDPADYDGLFQIAKHLESGQETEICALYKTGPRDIWMNYSDMVLAEGSHHGELWLTTLTDLPAVDNLGEPVELGKVVECDGSVGRFDPDAHPIAGGQGAGNDNSPKGALPPDVAYKIPANSYVIMDLHMLNATIDPIEACMKVGLHGIDAKKVKHEAGPIFMYNIMINSPKDGKATARQACPITKDITLVSGTSHMHKTGVKYQAKLLDGDPFDSDTKVKKVLYEGTEWESPVATIFEEPIKLHKGDWIDYHCDYENKTDHDIAGGTETRDEMCMFVGLGYPYDRSMFECALPGAGVINGPGSSGYQIGDGDETGADFLGCMLGNIGKPGATDFGSGFSGHTAEEYANNYDFQGCFVNACEPVGEFARPYFECFVENIDACQTDCTAAQANFQAQCTLTAKADGGCKEQYGTNGSNGTCVTDPAVGAAAVATCTGDTRAGIIDGICTELCGAACDDPGSAGCLTCKGEFDNMQANTECMNQQTLVCVGDEVKKSATACVTACLTDCITPKITDCVVGDCVNGDKCAELFGKLATTDCP